MSKKFWILRSNITGEYLQQIPVFRGVVLWTFIKDQAYEFDSLEEAQELTTKYIMEGDDPDGRTLDMDYDEEERPITKKKDGVFYLIRCKETNTYLRKFAWVATGVETWTPNIKSGKQFHHMETAKIAIDRLMVVTRTLAFIKCDYNYKVLDEIMVNTDVPEKKDYRARVEHPGGSVEVLCHSMTEEAALRKLFREVNRIGTPIYQAFLQIITPKQLPGTTPVTERAIGPSL